MYRLLPLLLILQLPISLLSQNDISVESILINATFQHISCHVNISGDENKNSNLHLQYKPKNSVTYNPGADCMRATPDMVIDGSTLNMNFHAGSIMFLEPNTWYDIRLVLTDPDGGTITIDREIITKNYPSFPSNSSIISVNMSDGADGIQMAINNATTGDIIEVEDGTYNAFEIDRNDIFLRSKNLHGAIIDGNNTDRGVITLNKGGDSIRNIIIDGFKIRNGRWGIDGQHTQYLTIQNCDIYDVDYGIVNRRANSWEHDQYITNNRLAGRTSWPQSNDNIPSERGIDLRGNNNVISYNTISNFGDGITTDGPSYRASYSLDIHHNNVFRIVDDLIEVDGMVSNSRVYSNRAWNGRAGISLAPVYGGPAYIFRNEFVNMEKSTYKMNRSPAGLYIVHNTTIQSSDGMSSDAGWQNTFMKNNLVFSGFYCFQEYGQVSGSIDDWNYNGYYSERAGTSGTPWFKWDDTRYSKLPQLRVGTGLELNGIEIDLTDIDIDSLPTSPYLEALTTAFDLSLPTSSNAIDTGILLPNISLPYVLDGKPDLGAREYGSSPIYGHDFDDICHEGDLDVMIWTGAVSHSWFDRRNWTPCGVPGENTEVIIPDGLMRYPTVLGDVIVMKLLLGN